MCFLLLLVCWLYSSDAQLLIGPDTVLVVPPKDRTPGFDLALRDISQDFYGTLGRPPVVLGTGLRQKVSTL